MGGHRRHAEYGDRLWLAELDLSEIASIRGVVDRAWAALGRIDGVVSNAGYGLMDAAEELTDDQVCHRSTPIWSAQSNWSARRFHICAHRAAAGSYSFQAWGAKSPFPAARSITPPSGASRASPMRSHKKWRCSGSAAR